MILQAITYPGGYTILILSCIGLDNLPQSWLDLDQSR